MPYIYLDHEADIGLEGTGETLETAFESGIQGLLDLLVDTDTVDPAESAEVAAVGADPAGLFVAMLNAVIAERDITARFFHSFRLHRIEQDNGLWRAEGTLLGESVDFSRHSVGNEVKAATYSGLRFVDEPGHKSLRCVLDI
jgi:SHS2 domain-containing protein